MIRALFFDAFRTLFDDSGLHEAASNYIIDHYAIDSVSSDDLHARWDEFIVEAWSGGGGFDVQHAMFEKSLRNTFDFFGISGADPAHCIEHWMGMVADSKLYPEAEHVIAELSSQYNIAIVSNTDNYELGECLKRHPLPVKAVVTSEDAKCYKPNRGIFDLALAALGARPEEAIVIGDSQVTDVQGAAAAGIRSIWINRRNSKPRPGLPEPAATLPDLSGVPDALRRLAEIEKL